MNQQQFLTFTHLAEAKGHKLNPPIETSQGWEAIAEKDGKAAFTGIASTPERAMHLCVHSIP